MSRRQSFVPNRGPILENPGASLLPDPRQIVPEPFTVPKAPARTWIKSIIILGVGLGVLLFALGAFQ